MTFARRQFVETGSNPVAAVVLGSTIEGGGTLSTYLVASMPEHADLPPFADGLPSGPWSIALRQVGADTIIVEGFGEGTDHPLLADTVLMRPRHRP
jgi:hypothetical protein